MKKIFNTILLLVIGLMLVFPASSVQASTTLQRYYRAYRSELKGFLVNYRANTSDRQGCVRTKQKPDGLNSDCLSQKKINEIMQQLDEDGFFFVRDAYSRRQYLFTTKKHRSVMRKPVMYFEQILNPDTVVYGSTPVPGKNFSAVDRVIAAPANIAGFAWSGVTGAPSQGDSIIMAEALTYVQTVVNGKKQRDYSYKPKHLITQATLNKIYGSVYGATRLSKYSANNIPTKVSWTTEEAVELEKVAVLAEYSFNHHWAKSSTFMANLFTSSIAMGGLGAESRVGGAVVGKAGALSQANRATYAIGRYSANVNEAVLTRSFSNSSAVTSLVNAYMPETGQNILVNPALYRMDQVSRAMQVVNQQNWKYFPVGGESLDQLLVRRLENNVYFANDDYFKNVLKLPSAAGAHQSGDIFIRDLADVVKADGGYWLKPLDNVGIYTHETVHLERWLARSKVGFPNDYSLGLEDLTEFISEGSLARAGVSVKQSNGFLYPDYIRAIAQKMAQKNGWTLKEAIDKLFWINSNASPYEIDRFMGGGFWDEYVNQRSLLDICRREYVTTPSTRSVTAPKMLSTQKNIADLIRSR